MRNQLGDRLHNPGGPWGCTGENAGMTPDSECHYIVTLTEAAKTGREIEIATRKLMSTHFYCEAELLKMCILAGGV